MTVVMLSDVEGMRRLLQSLLVKLLLALLLQLLLMLLLQLMMILLLLKSLVAQSSKLPRVLIVLLLVLVQVLCSWARRSGRTCRRRAVAIRRRRRLV